MCIAQSHYYALAQTVVGCQLVGVAQQQVHLGTAYCCAFGCHEESGKHSVALVALLFGGKLKQQWQRSLGLVVYQYLVGVVGCLVCRVGYSLVKALRPERQSHGLGLCCYFYWCLLLACMYGNNLRHLILYARLCNRSLG